MDFRKKRPSCAEVKEQDLVAYLSSLGYEPARIKCNDYWYLSPFRAEKTASFKVNRKLNRWYDHGLGKGGNLIDFAILYYDCTVAEFLKGIGAEFSFQQPAAFRQFPAQNSEPEPTIEIVSVGTICSEELLNYLRERKISIPIARQYCREIKYRFNGSSYFGIGFKNDGDGYEIRNRYFKGSCKPKAPTPIQNGAQIILVFEGFFDFLSYLTITAAMDVPLQDFFILNSLSFFEQSIPFLQGYETIRLFLDNDSAGRKYVQAANESGLPVIDESKIYANYKDLNDFVTGKMIPHS